MTPAEAIGLCPGSGVGQSVRPSLPRGGVVFDSRSSPTVSYLGPHGSLTSCTVNDIDNVAKVLFVGDAVGGLGGEFGFGAEIGISTDKFHARGPCGLIELTSYKYVIYGDGQVRG